MTGTLKIKDMTPEQKKAYMKEAQKKHYLKNRIERIKQSLKYYHEHKEEIIPKVRDYYWDNREDCCENARIRRELRKMAAE